MAYEQAPTRKRPKLLSITYPAANKIRLNFSNRLKRTTAMLSTSNYTVSNGITVSSVARYKQMAVDLTVSTIPPYTTPQVAVAYMEDVNGYPLPKSTVYRTASKAYTVAGYAPVVIGAYLVESGKIRVYFNKAVSGLATATYSISGPTTLTATGATAVNAQIVDVSFTGAASSVTYTSTERKPRGDEDTHWAPVACNASGAVILAGESGVDSPVPDPDEGAVFNSSNYGASWSMNSPTLLEWICLASDHDGSNLIGAAEYDGIYISSNYGTSWSEVRPAGGEFGDHYWYACASDATGTRLAVAEYYGRLWLSTNRGTTWTEKRPAGNTNYPWYWISMSYDGSKIYALGYFSRMWFSGDYGATWVERRPLGDANGRWTASACSYDGKFAVVMAWSGRIFTTSDYGASWTERRPLGDTDVFWQAIACDQLGGNIAVCSSTRLYVSHDSGVTWAEHRPAGDVDKYWLGLALNAAGTRLVSGAYNGRLYTSVATNPYTISVSGDVEDIYGNTIDPAANSATFVA